MPGQINSEMQPRPDFSAMAEKWPSSHVERQSVREFSGNVCAPGTVANHDSKGTGPEGAVRIGNRVLYPVKSFIAWLEDRAANTRIRRGRIGGSNLAICEPKKSRAKSGFSREKKERTVHK